MAAEVTTAGLGIETEFMGLIRKFNNLVDNRPPKEKISKQLLELKSNASNNVNLNSRQVGAVVDRVDNYLNGTYKM